jgi:hypothetical protein
MVEAGFHRWRHPVGAAADWQGLAALWATELSPLTDLSVDGLRDDPQTAGHCLLDLGDADAMALGKLAIAQFLDAVAEKDRAVGPVDRA